MTILLQRLVENAWILYALCAAGIVIYVVRALAARQERNLAMFTLEREIATSRIVQAWAMVLIFTIIGVAIYASVTFVLPTLPGYSETSLPTPTSVAGVNPPTTVLTTTPSPTIGFQVPTFTPEATSAPVPTPPPPDTPAPAPTDVPVAAVSGDVYVRFGDFAALVGYSLPATEITAAQPLLLTLRWQALEGTSPMNYVVFTHLLLEDDTIIAQDDGQPADGTRPMTGWVSGEIIVDPHPMEFRDTTYTGPAKIAIGLYDPATGRVPTDTGDNRVVLPITIIVISQ